MSDEELEKKEREAYKEELGIEKTKLQILKLQGLLPGSNGSGKSGNRSGNRSGDGSETGDGSVSMKYSMLDKQTRDDFNKYLTTLHDYNRLPPHKKTQEQIDDIKEMRNSLVDRYTEKEVRDMENAFFNENVTEPEFKKKVTNINRELQRNNISIKIDDENFDIDNPQDIAVLEEEMAKKIKSYTPEQIEELQKNLDNQPLRVRKLVRDIYQKYSPKR